MEELDEEILLPIENVALFAEEGILWVLRWHNLDWFPPVSTENLRKYSKFDLFTVEIGKALAEQCMEEESIAVAALTGFNVEAWLQMPLNEARMYVKQHFIEFIIVLPVGNQFKHLFLWAFACYLCRRAILSDQRIFISHVFTQLLDRMYSNHKYLSYYEYLNVKATSYNLQHFFLHNRHADVGYYTGSDVESIDDLEEV